MVCAGLSAMTTDTATLRTALAATAPAELHDFLPELDRRLRSIYEWLDGCRRFLILYRPSARTLYDPVAVARAQSAQLVGPPVAMTASRQFNGDPEQVRECLRLIVENGRLTQGGTLALEIHVEGECPRIVARLNNAAALPDIFVVAGPFRLPLEDLRERWNAATGGGRLDVAGAGLIMNLRGTRRPPRDYPWAGEVLEPVSDAARALIPWRGAIGHYEFGMDADTESLHLYGQILEKVQTLLQDAKNRTPLVG
jgi:hypothetical protein